MELGHQNHTGDGLLGPNSIIVVYMDPLGIYGDYCAAARRTKSSKSQTLTPDPYTQRLHGSSFLGLPYRILNMNPKKELLWSLIRAGSSSCTWDLPS